MRRGDERANRGGCKQKLHTLRRLRKRFPLPAPRRTTRGVKSTADQLAEVVDVAAALVEDWQEQARTLA